MQQSQSELNKVSKIIIDVSKVKSIEDLHFLMKRKFSFPDWYGANLDALWDSLIDYCLSHKINYIEFSNFGDLNNRLDSNYVNKLRILLIDVVRYTEDTTLKIDKEIITKRTIDVN